MNQEKHDRTSFGRKFSQRYLYDKLNAITMEAAAVIVSLTLAVLAAVIGHFRSIGNLEKKIHAIEKQLIELRIAKQEYQNHQQLIYKIIRKSAKGLK